MTLLLKALPNLFVVLHPICVVDVSGIDDSSTLERTFLATLWEHGYGRQIESEGGDKIILSLEPFGEDRRYLGYPVVAESSFSLSTQQNTDSGQPSPLFKLCAESSTSGTFQMFVRIYLAPRFHAAGFGVNSLFWERGRVLLPPNLPGITIVSKNDRSFLCHVYLKDVDVQTTDTESVLRRVVQELQVIQYYFDQGRPTDLAPDHDLVPHWVSEQFFDFAKYLKDIFDSHGNLILLANVYKAKTARKLTMAAPSSDVCDVPSVVGQKKPTPMIVKIFARRESDIACMVYLAGIEDPSTIRQRITHALVKHNYLIRGRVLLTDKDVSTATCHQPLTDEQLFALCFCKGDSKGILGIFAEVSKIVFPYEYKCHVVKTTQISNISVKITDWESGVKYGCVSFDAQSSSDACYYEHLIYKIHEYAQKEIVALFGPGPDFLFSLDARLLSQLLHLKGDKKGTLAISIIIDPGKKIRGDYMQFGCRCHYCGEKQRVSRERSRWAA